MTASDFRLPDLGEGLESAEIVRWLVAVGETVVVDQPLVEVVTAKASVELPAPFPGRVTTLHYAPGDVVPVGAPLVSVETGSDAVAATPGQRADATDRGSGAEAVPPLHEAGEGDSASGSGSVLVGYGTRPERRRRRRVAAAAPGVAAAQWGAAAASAPDRPAASAPDRPAASAPDRPAASAPDRPAVMSPVVRRLAARLQVDLAALAGSGPDGVITRGDVEEAADHAGSARVGAPGRGRATGVAAALSEGQAVGGPRSEPAGDPTEVERLRLTGARRQMAEHLARSRREIPEATVWVDADASGLLEARRLFDEAHPERTGTGIASWLARFCVLGLARFPLLNSRIEGDEIVVGRRVNLGFAAQTEAGLVVPVVHHADELTLLELDGEIRRLTEAGRRGRLTPGELTGGTFTLNNYGVFGVDGSAAIINAPEVAIVGVGRIVDRGWVAGGSLVVRPVTELTLSFDHRVCDGGVAGGFLRFLADCVEAPVRLLDL